MNASIWGGVLVTCQPLVVAMSQVVLRCVYGN